MEICQICLINKIAHVQAIYIHTSAPTWSKHMPGGKPSCSGPYNLRDCKASALTMAEVTSRLYGSHIYGRVTGKWHVLQPCWPRHRHMQGELQFRQWWKHTQSANYPEMRGPQQWQSLSKLSAEYPARPSARSEIRAAILFLQLLNLAQASVVGPTRVCKHEGRISRKISKTFSVRLSCKVPTDGICCMFWMMGKDKLEAPKKYSHPLPRCQKDSRSGGWDTASTVLSSSWLLPPLGRDPAATWSSLLKSPQSEEPYNHICFGSESVHVLVRQHRQPMQVDRFLKCRRMQQKT